MTDFDREWRFKQFLGAREIAKYLSVGRSTAYNIIDLLIDTGEHIEFKLGEAKKPIRKVCKQSFLKWVRENSRAGD